MSATLSYQAETRSLTVQGACADGDCPALREALNTFGRMAHELTVDLTAVEDLTRAVADLLAEAGREARRVGREITITRTPDTQVDFEILAAAARTAPG